VADHRPDRWDDVKDLMAQARPVELGQHVAYWMRKTPRRALYSTSYYKFASKMLGRGRRVLDIGCGEGLGTYLLAVECGGAVGVDFDEDAIEVAKKNWQDPRIAFHCADALSFTGQQAFDGVVHFDVIEHIAPEHADDFLKRTADLLAPEGVYVLGTPNITAREHASAVTNAGHINLYSGERLEEALRRQFRFVFMFGANDEVVHTGFLPMAHYLLGVGCGGL
jgi:2-polyprenyl-3-methyl-5-hydroxy-6-metoxy-1,4-benzoquinol methylase